MSGFNKRLRIKLHAENPHCHWCGCVTLLLSGQRHPDAATLEHLISRLAPDTSQRNKPENIRIACYKCNHARGQAEERAMCKAELLKRSLRGRGMKSWFESWEREMDRWERF